MQKSRKRFFAMSIALSIMAGICVGLLIFRPFSNFQWRLAGGADKLSLFAHLPVNHIDYYNSVSQPDGFENITSSVNEWNFVRRKESRDLWNRALSLRPEVAALLASRDVFSMFPATFECDRNYMYKYGAYVRASLNYFNCTRIFTVKSWRTWRWRQMDGDDCTVLSLGSNGQFEFDLSIVQITKGACKVHVLDCTGSWPSPHPNIIFHPWCLSSEDSVKENGWQYKSWSSVIKTLGVNRIDFLKMDIESYEWDILPNMLAAPEKSLLPRQISFELHAAQTTEVASELNVHGPGGFLWSAIHLFQMFDARGYQIAATEYNWLAPGCCQEFTLVNVDAE